MHTCKPKTRHPVPRVSTVPTKPTPLKSAVCGFMFDKRTQELVALIRKKRPDWQAGKVNGVGGKIERGEKAHAAMVREFQEETGVKTAATAWELFSC